MDFLKKIITIIEEEAKLINIASVLWSINEITLEQTLLGNAPEYSIQLLGLAQRSSQNVNQLTQDLDNTTDENDRAKIIEKIIVEDKLKGMFTDLFSSSLTIEFSEKLKPNETITFAENYQVCSEEKDSENYQVASVSIKSAIELALEQSNKPRHPKKPETFY